MSIPFLRQSTHFNYNGVNCEVLNIYRNENELRYREIHDEDDTSSYSTKLIPLSDFSRAIKAGDIQIEKFQAENFSRYLTAEQSVQIDYRERYVLRAIKESPSAPTRPAAVDEAIKVVSGNTSDNNPPCRSTVQGWVKRYRDSGYNKMSLMDGFISTKTRQRYIPEVEEAFQDCIADYFLCNSPKSVKHIYKYFCDKVEAIKAEHAEDPRYNFKVPCLNTLRNRIKALSDEEVLIAKYGKTKAKQKIRAKLKKFRVSTILERCEMDGLHIHIGIVDKNDTTVFLGTVVLMYVMDVYSRVILGYSLHITKKKSETADLILACLKHALSFDRDRRWPIVNKLPLVATDASAPATSDICSPFLIANNITLLITTARQPQEKPFIESLNNTIRRMFLRFLPGYLGREKFRGNTIKLGENVKDQASMTLEGFIREFEHFIHEVYHKNPHSGLNGRAPIDVWNEDFNKQPLAIREQVRLPSATELYGCNAERKFHKNEDGFFIDGRWYRDSGLHKWLISSKDGHTGYAEKEVFSNVTILYSQIDVRFITVIHPKTKEPRQVSCSDLDAYGIPNEKPLQREVFKHLAEERVMNIPLAEQRFYEPSKDTVNTARSIEKQHRLLRTDKKNQQSERRKQNAQHHPVYSEEYANEMSSLAGNVSVVPKNVITHSSSQSTSIDDDVYEEWENEIDLDDIGN
ncbi:hypothetical protein [Paraglaciecola sp.]|uniref:hypothetical protein n=1 Tax=Paraglaciecola sp. TaxID=1920173 RepID=UPI00273EC5E7|nr:hypothetical protein [Paraglaciecola sp.]MDP5032701.1 hypothetical protein [Paraglaciecola sp.]